MISPLGGSKEGHPASFVSTNVIEAAPRGSVRPTPVVGVVGRGPESKQAIFLQPGPRPNPWQVATDASRFATTPSCPSSAHTNDTATRHRLGTSRSWPTRSHSQAQCPKRQLIFQAGPTTCSSSNCRLRSTSPVSSGRESLTWRPVRVRTRRPSAMSMASLQSSLLASESPHSSTGCFRVWWSGGDLLGLGLLACGSCRLG